MAKKSQRARAVARKRFGTPDIAGTFAYRFSGYAIVQSQSWWLTGVGRFDIDADGILEGAHHSAIMALKGAQANVSNSGYKLKGDITMKSDGSGNATIEFTNTTGTGLNLRAEFHVMLGGDTDHLWFISGNAEVPGVDNKPDRPAHESVTLEAVRLTMPRQRR